METLESLKKQVGARIRELRKAAGYKSVDEVAAKVGVSNTTIYELERGENWISPDMAESLAVAFSCSVPAFFDNVGTPRAPAKSAKLLLFELIAAMNEAEANEILLFAKDFKAAGAGKLLAKPEGSKSEPVVNKARKS
jgi:transcriptional regulator with XRE-family HTH domain